MGFADVRKAERETGAENEAFVQSLLGYGGKAVPGGVAFEAPKVDISRSIAKRRGEIAAERQRSQDVIREQGLNPRAAQGVPSLAEAGFITPEGTEESFFSHAPMATYASPGFVEAGHRRPEDIDPMRMEDYRRAYLRQQTERY